eukprot:TRINITY_DN31771_c0_g1_i1.p2 TRINITY_DN31771_c0_g1~~TRINITY_DN31771_c0_g1_i1.p2  ORF type:complete len:265 (+),score=45.49 TRINITY_DN31771_c0_g1_i1:266-1060(+)
MAAQAAARLAARARVGDATRGVVVTHVAMAGALVAKTRAWEAASYAPVYLATVVYYKAVNAALRDEVQWRLLPRSARGAALSRTALKFVLCGAGFLFTWATARLVDLSGCKIYVMFACSVVLADVLFYHGAPREEESVWRCLFWPVVSVSARDGLFRAGYFDWRVVPLHCVCAFGASAVEVGDCFAPRREALLTVQLRTPWEALPIALESLSICEHVASQFEAALRRCQPPTRRSAKMNKSNSFVIEPNQSASVPVQFVDHFEE